MDLQKELTKLKNNQFNNLEHFKQSYESNKVFIEEQRNKISTANLVNTILDVLIWRENRLKTDKVIYLVSANNYTDKDEKLYNDIIEILKSFNITAYKKYNLISKDYELIVKYSEIDYNDFSKLQNNWINSFIDKNTYTTNTLKTITNKDFIFVKSNTVKYFDFTNISMQLQLNCKPRGYKKDEEGRNIIYFPQIVNSSLKYGYYPLYFYSSFKYIQQKNIGDYNLKVNTGVTYNKTHSFLILSIPGCELLFTMGFDLANNCYVIDNGYDKLTYKPKEKVLLQDFINNFFKILKVKQELINNG